MTPYLLLYEYWFCICNLGHVAFATMYGLSETSDGTTPGSFTSNIVSTNRGSDIALITGKLIDKAGLWRDPSGGGVHFLAKAAVFCYVGNLVFQIVAVFMANDMERLFECLSVLTFCIMGILKLASLQRNHGTWQRLIFNMKKMEEKYFHLKRNDLDYESDGGETTIPFSGCVQGYTQQFQALSVVLSRIYYMTVSVFLLSPFVEYVFWKIRGRDCGYLHVLPGWAPWDEYSSVAYFISVSSEVVACVYCLTVHLAFDITAVGLMIFICGQFKILRDYSELIGGRGKRFAICKNRDDRAHFRIKVCHQTQIFLASSITELNKLLKGILGIYFGVATLTLCSVGLRLILEDMPMMQLIPVIQYTFGTLTQLFLFCYFGNAVQHESSLRTGEGVFGAAVWCLSPRVRREIVLLGFSMMKPRLLQAGPFNTVNLPSFLLILRTAYSYYAVIRNQS